MASYDDLKTGTITLVGVVSALITFIIIVAAQVLYFQFQAIEHQKKFIDAPLAQTETKVRAMEDELNNYTWVDPDKGSVSIPISTAMETVLNDVKSGNNAENDESDSGETLDSETKSSPEETGETDS